MWDINFDEYICTHVVVAAVVLWCTVAAAASCRATASPVTSLNHRSLVGNTAILGMFDERTR